LAILTLIIIKYLAMVYKVFTCNYIARFIT